MSARRRTDERGRGVTIASVLSRGYSQFRDLPAVIGADGTITTYAQLGHQARTLVAGLQALGVGVGSRVAVLAKNRAETFLIDHALAIGGLARIALLYRLHAREILEIIQDAGAAAIIVDGERGREMSLALDAAGVKVTIVSLDEGPGDRAILFSDLLGGPEADEVDVRPDDIAWLPYTSGTSGRPKGVIHTHRSLLAVIRNVLVELPSASADDVLIHAAPLTHLSGYAMLAHTFRGAAQVALDRFEPERYLTAVEQHGATVLPLVPTMINLLLPAVETGEYDVSTVHTILYGGAPIAPDRLARGACGLRFGVRPVLRPDRIPVGDLAGQVRPRLKPHEAGTEAARVCRSSQSLCRDAAHGCRRRGEDRRRARGDPAAWGRRHGRLLEPPRRDRRNDPR